MSKAGSGAIWAPEHEARARENKNSRVRKYRFITFLLIFAGKSYVLRMIETKNLKLSFHLA
jgi:hypothetical protein